MGLPFHVIVWICLYLLYANTFLLTRNVYSLSVYYFKAFEPSARIFISAKVHAYNVYTLIPELPDCMNKLAKLIYNTALCFSLYLPFAFFVSLTALMTRDLFFLRGLLFKQNADMRHHLSVGIRTLANCDHSSPATWCLFTCIHNYCQG